MRYSIKEISQLVNMSAHTIRYYEKIGLLPKAERNENKYRVYMTEDVDRLKLISCIKKTGMPLEEIKPYLDMDLDGDLSDYPNLVEMALNHKKKVEKQIEDLQIVVDFIDRKLELGTFKRSECQKINEENVQLRSYHLN